LSRFLFVNCSLVLAAIGLPLASQGQTLNQQAQSQANSFWNQRLTRCGDTAYVAFKNGEVDAFKNAQTVVQAQPLNEADRLNGWEWKGVTGFTATATRMWVAHETLGVYGPLGWQPWVPGTGPAGMFGIYTASVEKLHGAWRVVPNPVFPLSEMKAFNCSQIPPEQFDPNSALVQQELKAGACRKFMSAATGGNPIANYDQVNSLQTWINTGIDVKICRDEAGNTVLMKLAFQLYPPEEAIRHLLSLGVDANARNNAGLSAKDIAQQNYNNQLPGGSMAGYDSASFASIGRVINLLQSVLAPQPDQVKKGKKKGDAGLSGSIPGAKEIRGSIDSGRIDDIQKLLRSGVSPNLAIDDYYTLLGAAAYDGQVEIVKLLLNSGADPNLTPKGGASYSPLGLALLQNKGDVADLLRAAGAK